MEPEYNPLGLLRQRRSINRVEAAMRKTEEIPKPGGYRYLGRNADTGQGLIVGNDGSVIPGDIITSGHIKPGQAVRVAQAGGLVQLDQKPRVKKIVPPVVKKEEYGPVKILFSVLDGSDRVYYVGGDRRAPEEIYRIPSSISVSSVHLSNLGKGKNKWVMGLKYSSGPRGSNYITTVTPQEVFTKTNEVFLDWGAQLNWRGQGFWASQTGRLITISESYTDLPTETRPINPPVPPGVEFGDPFFYIAVNGLIAASENQARLYYSYQNGLDYTIQSLSVSQRVRDFPDNEYGRGTKSTTAQITPTLTTFATQSVNDPNPNNSTNFADPQPDPYAVITDVAGNVGVFARSSSLGPVLYLVTDLGVSPLDTSIYRSPAWISLGESLSDFSKITFTSGDFYRVVFGEGLTQTLNPDGKITVDSVDLESATSKKISAKFFPIATESAIIHDASYHP